MLNIETDTNKKAVTFTVHNRPSFFLNYLRAPVIGLLLALSSPSLIEIKNSFSGSGVTLSAYLLRFINHVLSERDPSFEGLLSHIALATTFIMLALVSATLQQPSDSIVIMENMGVQLSSRSWWSLSNRLRNSEFIPLSDIIDIVIHEGFHGYGQVIFYMCVLTRARSSNSDSGTGNSVKVVFPNFLPRMDILLQVWKQSRTMLYGQSRKHYRRVPGEGLREIKHLH